MMAAYLVAQIEHVHDEAQFATYRRDVTPVIIQYGGRRLASAGDVTVIDGQWQADGLVLIEWESMEHLRTWYDSPEMVPLIALRQRSAQVTIIAFEGLA